MASAYEQIFEEEREKDLGDVLLFKWLWKYIKKYAAILAIAFISLGLTTAVDLSVPNIIRYGIDNLLNVQYKFNLVGENFVYSENGEYTAVIEDHVYYMVKDGEKTTVPDSYYKDASSKSISKIDSFAVLFLCLLMVQLLFNYGQVFFSNLLGQKVIYDIRSELFGHVEKIKYDFFTKNPSGKITTRIVNDTQNISEFFTEVLTSLTKDIAILTGVVILMFRLNIRLSGYVVITFPIVLIATYIFRRFDRKAYNKLRTRVAAINAYLAENISGSTVTKLFNQEKRKKDEFNDINFKLYRSKLEQMFVFAVFRPIMTLLYYITLCILLWFGSKGVRDGFVSFGVLYAFTAYIDMFFNPLFDIAEKYDIMQGAFASAAKIYKLLKQEEEEPGKCLYKDIEKGSVTFKDVWFSYSSDHIEDKDHEYVLKGASFTIKESERVAIVGETGSGKTTTVNLINGLYKFQKGDILLDGKPLFDYDVSNLRRRIAVVPQDVFLFSGNITNNIRLFNENITKEQVEQAAKKVYADEVIKKLPQAYDSELLERGSTLSSGERQLIALARAVLFDAKIIILDEATANIDVETEYLIQKALNDLSADKTIISIAHRLSTVKSSKRIIVVHKGRVAEEGSHDELMAKKGIYFDLYRLQFENS